MTHILDAIREAAALIRREEMRAVGTPEEEARRAIVIAIVGGAPLVVNPVLRAGTVVRVEGKVYFHSEKERDAFLAVLGVERAEGEARHG